MMTGTRRAVRTTLGRPLGRISRAAVPVIAGAAVLAVACKPGAPTGPGAPPSSIAIDVSSVFFTASDEDTTFVAVALDGNGDPIPGVTFTWASSNEAVAIVTSEGVVTSVGSGTALITASARGVSSAPSTVTVRLPIATIEVQPPGLNFSTIGSTQTLTATALDATGAQVPGVMFRWASSDESVATVSSSGVVTSVSAGIATVTASAGAQTSAPVSVAVQLTIASIDVVPSSASLDFIGDTVTLTATARDPGGSPISGVTFTWASSDPGVATVSGAGVVTAVGNGTANITASIGTFSSPPVPVTVQQLAAVVDVTPTTLSLTFLGDTASLTAVARDAGGTVIAGASFNWTSADPAVASVSNVGRVTAASNGTTTVTAELDGVNSNAASVDVRQVVTSVDVAPTSVSFNVIGQTAQLTATALDAGGSPVPGINFTWNSSNPVAATVSQTGLVTAAGPGLAAVTATTTGGVVSNSVIVRVQASQVGFDAASSATALNSATMTWQHTISGGSNRLLVVGVTAEASSSSDVDVTNVTFNGAGLAKQIDEKLTAGFTSKAEIWILDENRLPPAGTYSVVVTFQGVVAEANSGAMSFENVNQSSPEATASNTAITQQGIATNITTSTPLAWVVDVVHAGAPGSFAPGLAQIERFDVGSSGARAAGSTREIVSPGPVTVTQTHSAVANRLVHTAIVITPQ